jgi:hypothetical protein
LLAIAGYGTPQELAIAAIAVRRRGVSPAAAGDTCMMETGNGGAVFIIRRV